MRCGLEAKLVRGSRQPQHGFDVALDVEIVDLGSGAVPMLGSTRAERQSRDHGGLRDALPGRGRKLRADLEQAQPLALMGSR